MLHSVWTCLFFYPLFLLCFKVEIAGANIANRLAELVPSIAIIDFLLSW